jgi:butyrate kinase
MAALSKKEEQRVFEVIDHVLKQVFGEEATRLMYQYLERHYSWNQRDFTEKIDAFAKGMEEFLSSGAYAVENKILDSIYSSYDVRKAGNVGSFVECDFASQIRLAMQKA